jgi:hypothetical protein
MQKETHMRQVEAPAPTSTDDRGLKWEGPLPGSLGGMGAGRGGHPEDAAAGAGNGRYNPRARADTRVGLDSPILRIPPLNVKD